MTAYRPRPQTPAPLQIPDLTLPRDDTTTVRRLIVRDTRRWTAALRAFPLARLHPDERALFAAAATAFSALQERDAGRAGAVLRLPTLAVLLELTAKEGAGADEAALRARGREIAALLLLELAALGALPPEGVAVQRPEAGWPILRTLSARLELHVEGSVSTLRFLPGALALRAGTDAETSLALADAQTLPGLCRVERPYHEIVPGLLLAVSDNNPLSDFEAHPDKDGNALDLGGRPAEAWTAMLRDAVELVQTHLPLLAEEMRLLLRLVVPVGYDAEKHLSASYQEYVGAIYMTLHPNLMTMTEALIHEFQHNKINAAFHHDPMLHNAFWPLVQSPVRPDPRPLHGVVLAVHAFQPVATLYRAMADAGHPMAQSRDWQRRAGVILGKIHDGAVTVLGQGEPTPVGRQLMQEMRALDVDLMRDGTQRGWLLAPEAVAAGGDEP
jgi:HEXXH motif-containing protein